MQLHRLQARYPQATGTAQLGKFFYARREALRASAQQPLHSESMGGGAESRGKAIRDQLGLTQVPPGTRSLASAALPHSSLPGRCTLIIVPLAGATTAPSPNH